jgi:hypothetical protein
LIDNQEVVFPQFGMDREFPFIGATCAMKQDGNRVPLAAAPVRVHPRKPYLFENLATCLRALLPYRCLERFAIVPPENSEQPRRNHEDSISLPLFGRFQSDPNISSIKTSTRITSSNPFAGSGMPNQIHGVRPEPTEQQYLSLLREVVVVLSFIMVGSD